MMLRLTCSTLAVIAMTAPAAFSLTADEVWQTWETYLADSGYEIAIGNRDGGGDSLVLKDVVLTAAPDESSTTKITLPEVRMGLTGGGDVRTEYPAPADLHFTSETIQDGETVTMVMTGNIDLSKLESISREEGGHQVDTSTASELTVAITSMTIGDDDLGDAPITLTMRDMTSATTFLGGLNTLTDSRIGGLTGTIDIADTEDSAVVKGTVELGETAFTTETNFPEGTSTATPAELNEALRAGAAMTGKGSFASLSMDIDATGNDEAGAQNMRFVIKGGAGSGEFGLAESQLRYQFDVTDVNYDLQGDEIPFPIQVAIGAASTDLQFPLLASEEAQPFKFAYSLNELTLNDAIWGMIDPQGALPHDPASLDVDLTGELLVDADLMTYAETAEQNPGEAPPIRPVGLTLSQLALSAVGASATANGAVSFPDPNNLEVATGTLDAQFNGVSGLIDKLESAGFIGPDEVQGARMMLMMFAKPVEGQDDALQTKLEMKEDGSVFANGMQLK